MRDKKHPFYSEDSEDSDDSSLNTDTDTDTDSDLQKDLQQFQSQNGEPLQSLRGQYQVLDRSLKTYYILWDDVEAAFPGIDHLRSPPSSCVFLVDRHCRMFTPLRILVDPKHVYTVVYKSSRGPDSMDPNRYLLYSNDSAPPLILTPEDAALKATLDCLASDKNLFPLLVNIRQVWKTYEDMAGDIKVLHKNERYKVFTLYLNMEHRHNKLLQSMASLLEEVGSIEAIQVEMAKVQEGLKKLQKDINTLEHKSRLNTVEDDDDKAPFDYPLPYPLLLLPYDVDSWDPENPRAHTFRLHYLCNYASSLKVRSHDNGDTNDSNSEYRISHLHQHPGYAIREWDYFLQRFGFVVLTFMQEIQDRIETELEEARMTGKNDNGDASSQKLSELATGSPYSAGELRVLLNIAITCLKQLVAPHMMLENNADALRRLSSLLIDNDDNTHKVAGLYPNIREGSMIWTCSHHFHLTYTDSALVTLRQHVSSLAGDYNMEQGTATIKAHSMEDVQTFYNLTQGIKNVLDLTATLLWDATEAEMRQILEGTDTTGIFILRLDGNVFRNHPIYTTERGNVYIRNFVASNDHTLDSVTFANIQDSNSVEYVTFIIDRRIVTTGVPTRMSMEWDKFKQGVVGFHKAVGFESEYSGNDSDIHSSDARGVLHELAATHHYIKSLTYLTETHQVATFEMQDGTFHGLVEARFPVKFNEQLLYAGALRRFVLEIDADSDYLATLGKILASNPDILDVSMQTEERRLLSQIVFCCSYLQGRVHPVQLTFFDKCNGNQERVVAKLVLSSKAQDVTHNSSNDLDLRKLSPLDVDIKVLKCAVDHVSERMTDDEAAVLDMITEQAPDALTHFVLDTGRLTRTGIESLQRVVARSSIRFLRIECNAFDQDLREHLVLALAYIQRHLLVSLILCGKAVDTWLQLGVAATTSATSDLDLWKDKSEPLPQLAQFEVINTSTDRQVLSDKAVELILYIALSSPLIEIRLVNTDLQAGQQKNMIISEMDMEHVKSMGPASTNVQHVVSLHAFTEVANVENPTNKAASEEPALPTMDPELFTLELEFTMLESESLSVEPEPVSIESGPLSLESEIFTLEPERALNTLVLEKLELEPPILAPEPRSLEQELFTLELEFIILDSEPLVEQQEPSVRKPEHPVMKSDSTLISPKSPTLQQEPGQPSFFQKILKVFRRKSTVPIAKNRDGEGRVNDDEKVAEGTKSLWKRILKPFTLWLPFYKKARE
ncbi:hypothetical protein MVEG_02980 [Podila verticillata NRRL 6337]|nr:hypothetical protein MVEG_02980 [Podila verticillata NRRL 6337]